MSFETEGRKEARFGVLAVAGRVRYGGAYGRLPPPPQVLKTTNHHYVEAWSKEAGCLARGGPLRRCRDGAAVDCVDTLNPKP